MQQSCQSLSAVFVIPVTFGHAHLLALGSSAIVSRDMQFRLSRQIMIQTVLAINGCDCMIGDGNTPEELEAIAVTLLRAAEAIRNQEEGAIECVGNDGTALAFIHVHHCSPTCDIGDVDVPTIEHLACVAGRSERLRTISRSMIDQYRRMSMH